MNREPSMSPQSTSAAIGKPALEGEPAAAASSTASPPERPPARSQPWVQDLRKGDRVRGAVFLVETSNFKQTRDQKYFIQMVLRDRTGSIRAIRWKADEELYSSFAVDDFLLVDGRVEEFQKHPQLVVDSLARIDPRFVDAADFLPVSRRDIGEMQAELREAVAAVRDRHLRKLLRLFLDDPQVFAALSRCPAGKTLHHAYVGGLLEHILSLVNLSHAVARRYPRLNKDLLIAGAILHDIGKIEELSYGSNFSYTDSGQLLGHIGLGLLLIERKAAQIEDFPRELLLQLEHIVASHHGILEYGALKQPMTPEAIAFHYLDTLDAKMATVETIERELENAPLNDSGDGRWSEYKPHLGHRIFFPNGEDAPEPERRGG